MNNPTITVAIPVYNGAAFLSETLDSVLTQQFKDFEVLISDDGSTDNSLAIARSCRDSRVRIDAHSHLGMARNWNRCLQIASGTYIKLLPQDDLLRPDCLSASLQLLRQSARPTLVFSRRDILYDANDPWCAEWVKLYGRLDEPLHPLKPVNDGPELLRRWGEFDFHGNFIGEPATTVFPTELGRRLGGFPRTMQQDLDYVFWIRLMARGDVCFSAAPLCAYRFHQANATTQNYQQDKLGTERLKLLETLARDGAVRRHTPRITQLLRSERNAMLREQLNELSEATQVIGPIRQRIPQVRSLVARLIAARPTESDSRKLANETADPSPPAAMPQRFDRTGAASSASQNVGDLRSKTASSEPTDGSLHNTRALATHR